MQLTSSAFLDGGRIPPKYTCNGEGVSPPLVISEVPEGAKSLVLIMDDPDVPKYLRRDGMWDHWIVFNMPVSIRSIGEGEQPKGVAGKGTDGTLVYLGPAPPDCEHRYFFKVYALDGVLNLNEGATKREVECAMEGRILAQAQLMGRYEQIT